MFGSIFRMFGKGLGARKPGDLDGIDIGDGGFDVMTGGYSKPMSTPNKWEQFRQRWASNMQQQQPRNYDVEMAPMPGPVGGGIIPRQNPYPMPDPYMMYGQRPLFRRYGGPVRRGYPTVVGEDGPELLYPETDGTVVPNPATRFRMPEPIVDRGLEPSPETPGMDELQSIGNAAREGRMYGPPPTDAQMGQLAELGQSAKAGFRYYDPANYAGMGGTTAGEYPQPPEDPAIALNRLGPPPAMQNAATPKAAPDGGKGLFRSTGKTVADLQAESAALEDRIAKTQEGKDIDPVTGEKKREHSLWKRFGKGLINAYKNWDGQGGLLGLGVATLAGGIGSAASPQAHQVSELREDQGKLFRQMAPRMQYEKFAAQQNVLDSQAVENFAQAQKAHADQVLAQNKTTLEKIGARGEYFNRSADGSLTPVLHPVTKQPMTDNDIVRYLSDGTPFFTTGNKEADREAERSLNQARMDFEAKKLNQADLDAYEKEMQSWSTKVSEVGNQQVKLANDGLSKLNQAAAATDPEEKAKLEAEGNSLLNQSKNLQYPPQPKKPTASLTAPNLTVGQVSLADFTARAKAKGISGKNLEAAIAKAKADGVIK